MALLIVLDPIAADAHRLRAALTTVLLNEHSARIEVMHRFYVHDAEQVVAEIIGAGADVLDSAEDRLRFGVYVHERFSLDAEQVALPLDLIGVELEGDFLWVYQAAPLPAPAPGTIGIRHRALRDVWQDQVNTVNVEQGARVRTLTFTGTTDRLSVSLQRD